MKAIAVILVIFSIGVIDLCYSSFAHAGSESIWTNGLPRLVKSSEIVSNPATDCASYWQELFVVELGSSRSVCLQGGDGLKIGSFIENGQHKSVVGFPFSTNLHLLEGGCDSVCLYSPSLDMLVTQQRTSQYGVGMVVFKNVSKRIDRVVVSSSVVKYVFDATHPEYEMKNDKGGYVANRSMNISQNGRWVVTELQDKGLAVVDLKMMTTWQITTEGFRYGQGMDPTEELAISNDGKSVALTGQNSGLRVYDVVGDCGQELVNTLALLPSRTNCPSTDIGIGRFFPNFAEAHRPRFFGDGHQLELVVSSWGRGIHRTTFVTEGTTVAHQLGLLSLGDSFSSGEGETDEGQYVPGTNNAFDTCHVSNRSYSVLIARHLRIPVNEVKNLSCSGARISDIVGDRDMYWGQGNRLGSAGLGLSGIENAAAKERAVDDFQPGRTLQSSFIERYNPSILTVGIGGNDAGLMGKLRTCAMPGTCEWAAGEGVKKTAGEIQRLFDTMRSFLLQIKKDFPDSRVFVVGYPDIIDPSGQCDPVTGFLFDHNERVFIQSSVQYLNLVIKAASAKVGFTYLHIENSFEGSKLCNGSELSAMNGLRLGDDIAVIQALPMLKIIGSETFHPTPRGHELIASSIIEQNPAMTTVTSEDNNLGVDPSSYWMGDGVAVNRAAYVAEFARITDGVRQLKIELPDGTLQPHSIATIQIHSTPVKLATVLADSHGALNTTVEIPAGLDEGFHTLHILGNNNTGEDIDLYQFMATGVEGVAVESSVGEGSLSTAEVKTIQVQRGESEIARVGEVLGVQSTTGLSSSIQKISKPIISEIQTNFRSFEWVIFGLAVVAASGISTIIGILVARRWAKPRS